MGKIFSDATPDQEQEFIERRRKDIFLAACRWPLSWLRSAQRHKRAADVLFDVAHKAYGNEITRYLADVKAEGMNGGNRVLKGKELSDRLDMELLSEYLLLAGYAFECVFKGLLLARHPELVKEEKELDRSVTRHNLCDLCGRCGVAISTDESDLLSLLQWHVESGKYGVTKSLEQMPCPFGGNFQITGPSVMQNPFRERQLKKLVDGLFDRGWNLLNDERSSE